MFSLSAGSYAKTTQPTALCQAFHWFHWDGGQLPWQLKAHSGYWLADPFLFGVSGLSHRCHPQRSIAPRKMHHLRFLFRCRCSKCYFQWNKKRFYLRVFGSAACPLWNIFCFVFLLRSCKRNFWKDFLSFELQLLACFTVCFSRIKVLHFAFSLLR